MYLKPWGGVLAPARSLPMSSPGPAPAPPPPLTGKTGSQAAEIAIFSCVMVAYALYHLYYFGRHRMRALDRCCVPSLFGTVDLWTTAVESRVVWAKEMMRDTSEALLAVQTLRNVVVAATLIVMAMAQVLGRLISVVTTASAMEQINYYISGDPIAPHSFSSPQVKVGLSMAALLLSFGALAQAARLAVHMSFMIRVATTMARHRKQLEIPLKAELIAMTHRVSLYFSLGLRLLFLWAVLLAWCFGITAFLIFASVVLTLLAMSDFMPTAEAREQVNDRQEAAAEETARQLVDGRDGPGW